MWVCVPWLINLVLDHNTDLINIKLGWYLGVKIRVITLVFSELNRTSQWERHQPICCQAMVNIVVCEANISWYTNYLSWVHLQFPLKNRRPVLTASPNHFHIQICLTFCLFFLTGKCYHSNLLHHISLHFDYICFPMTTKNLNHVRWCIASSGTKILIKYPVVCNAPFFPAF